MRQNKAKGIWCDNSWDRWLEKFNANIYKKRLKVKYITARITDIYYIFITRVWKVGLKHKCNNR